MELGVLREKPLEWCCTAWWAVNGVLVHSMLWHHRFRVSEATRRSARKLVMEPGLAPTSRKDKYCTSGEGRDTPLDFCVAVLVRLEGIVDESRKKGRGRTVPQNRVT